MRPDIRSSRGECMKKDYEELEKEESEMLLAKSQYRFKMSEKQIQEAFKKQKEFVDSPKKSSVTSFFLSQFDEIWEKAERCYREHNIDEAFKKAS